MCDDVSADNPPAINFLVTQRSWYYYGWYLRLGELFNASMKYEFVEDLDLGGNDDVYVNFTTRGWQQRDIFYDRTTDFDEMTTYLRVVDDYTWTDIPENARNFGNFKPFGPLYPRTYLMMYYHDDAVPSGSLPNTWDELTELAKTAPVCIEECMVGEVFRAFVAQFMQSGQTNLSAWYDPHTMRPLAGDGCMNHTIDAFRRLLQHVGVVDGCTYNVRAFHESQSSCAITFAFDRAVYDMLLPGTDAMVVGLPHHAQVCDRGTGTPTQPEGGNGGAGHVDVVYSQWRSGVVQSVGVNADVQLWTSRQVMKSMFLDSQLLLAWNNTAYPHAFQFMNRYEDDYYNVSNNTSTDSRVVRLFDIVRGYVGHPHMALDLVSRRVGLFQNAFVTAVANMTKNVSTGVINEGLLAAYNMQLDLLDVEFHKRYNGFADPVERATADMTTLIIVLCVVTWALVFAILIGWGLYHQYEVRKKDIWGNIRRPRHKTKTTFVSVEAKDMLPGTMHMAVLKHRGYIIDLQADEEFVTQCVFHNAHDALAFVNDLVTMLPTLCVKPQEPARGSDCPVMTWDEFTKSTWVRTDEADPDAQRANELKNMRLAMHSGLEHVPHTSLRDSKEYAHVNEIRNAANFGFMLLTRTTYAQIPIQNNIAHIGDFKVGGSVEPLYEIFQHKCPFVHATVPVLDSIPIAQLGYKTAPVNKAAIVFAYVYGYGVLLNDLSPQHVQHIMDVVRDYVQELALTYSGTIINIVDGLFVMAFASNMQAVEWSVQLSRKMAEHVPQWPAEVLEHDICRANPDARGISMKIGIDFGDVSYEIVSNTGRINLKGKVLNRTSRIAYQASAGHIFCSERVARNWVSGPHRFAPLHKYNLKGVQDELMLYDVHTTPT